MRPARHKITRGARVSTGHLVFLFSASLGFYAEGGISLVSTTAESSTFVVAVALAILHLPNARELVGLVRCLLSLLATLVAATGTLSRLVTGVFGAMAGLVLLVAAVDAVATGVRAGSGVK